MRRAVGTAIVLICLAILIHDAGSGRMSVFRKVYSVDDLNRYVGYALYIARLGGEDEPDSLKILLRRGANPNGRYLGSTALHEAADNHKSFTRLLIDHGADIHARDQEGRTALHLAAEWGNAPVVAVLIENGAHVNATDNGGRTALDWADMKERKKAVVLLRKHGGKLGKELDK